MSSEAEALWFTIARWKEQVVNVETGRVYQSLDDALIAEEDPADLVEIRGTHDQVMQLSRDILHRNAAVKKRRRSRNKAARKARRKNR